MEQILAKWHDLLRQQNGYIFLFLWKASEFKAKGSRDKFPPPPWFHPHNQQKNKKKWRSSSIYIFWLPLWYLQTLLIKKNGCKFCQFHLIFFYLKKSARNFIWEKYKISKFLFIMSHTCMTHHFTRDVWALKTSLTLPLFIEVPVPVCPKNILTDYPEAEQHFRRIFSIWLSKF